MSSIVIEEFVVVTKNTLRGFARVRLPSGLVLHDVAIHQRDGNSSARPRQNSKPDSASKGAAMHDDSAMRYGSASRKAGMVHAAAHSNGVSTTAVQTGGPLSVSLRLGKSPHGHRSSARLGVTHRLCAIAAARRSTGAAGSNIDGMLADGTSL